MKRDFATLASQTFDLLVCGGGVYGAWTAYDAALRGLKVAIVEQNDWASATSSASSKLIHGGLRYLETYDFALISKSLKERARLLRTAPHRVWPLRFGVPVYAQQRINRLQLKLGLSVYDHLAGDLNPELRHRYWNSGEFGARYSILHEARLRGGFTYTDAQTDDARLVLELIAGAQDAGACCVNYCRLSGVLEVDGKAYGATACDRSVQNECIITAKQIVFTVGQWLVAENPHQNWCRLAKGVHLVMPGVLQHEALLLTAQSDGRVFFMIPWYGRTLLGTTDTDFNGDVDHVSVDQIDIDYLLAAANDYLKIPWKKDDILGYYAGVRVFKQDMQTAVVNSPSAISRDWEIKTDHRGVHYAIGGKMTSSRQDAAHLVDKVCAALGVSISCATDDRLFPWAPREDFSTWRTRMQLQAMQLGVDAESADWLLRRHGRRIDEILRRIMQDASLSQRIDPSLPFIVADLMQCAVAEMVVHLDDVLRRRMPLLILSRFSEDMLQRLAQRVAGLLGWDDARMQQEIARCRWYRSVL